jgi:hypothetical protein
MMLKMLAVLRAKVTVPVALEVTDREGRRAEMATKVGSPPRVAEAAVLLLAVTWADPERSAATKAAKRQSKRASFVFIVCDAA